MFCCLSVKKNITKKPKHPTNKIVPFDSRQPSNSCIPSDRDTPYSQIIQDLFCGLYKDSETTTPTNSKKTPIRIKSSTWQINEPRPSPIFPARIHRTKSRVYFDDELVTPIANLETTIQLF